MSSEAELEIPIVGIGYSAGGLESMLTLLSSFPPQSGAAIVVIPHLQEDYESHLCEVLEKSSELPVRTIENSMHIEANTVFLASPAFDVVLSGNFLNLNPKANTKAVHLGIDFFFVSLAHNRKSRAIGVILSGTGSDGTLGLKAIKAEGGITVVQDPKTAEFDGMPRSAIASGVADLILPPESIAPELSRLTKHPYTKLLQTHHDSSTPPEVDPPLSKENASFLERILRTLFEQTNVNFTFYKPSTIQRRIERQMMLRKIETIEKYSEYLQKNSDEVKALYEDIFIHVTDFFRDPESFEVLREKVFPEIVKGKTHEIPIRVWISGCATGEEVYSLAIAIIEYLEEHSLRIPLNLFASDISEPALQKARKGVYSETQLSRMSPERIDRFFEKMKDGYKITKHVRDLCIFSRHDVTSNPPIPQVDLLSCRNVLIYFSSALQKRLFPVFHYALKDLGFLWLGRAENPEASSKLFVAVDKSHKIFSKAPGTFSNQHRFSTPTYATGIPELIQPSTPVPSRASDMARNADQVILYRYSPPSVLINHEGDILQFRGRTVPYLEPSPGLASHSLLKMANPDIVTPLRECIQKAKAENAQARKENIKFEFEGKTKNASINVFPLNLSAPEKERQYLVVFEDSSTTRLPKSKTKTIPPSSRVSESVYAQLETYTQQNIQLRHELDAAREYQHSLIEEYESSQEELTSAIEELRSTNEELQSTNEELHSTNEELGSAKEELQAANEELLSINEELQKRNVELESALKEVDASEQRFRLIIDSVTDYAIYMIDPDGCINSWNAGAQRLTGYSSKEMIGTHFSRFYTQEDLAKCHPDYELDFAKKHGRYEEEGWRVRKDGSHFWASVIISAIRDLSGNVIGFSKVTRDLTERKKAEEVKQEEQRKAAILAQVQEREAVLDQIFLESPSFMTLISVPDYRYLKTNEEHLKLLGRSDIVGKTLQEIEPGLEAQGFFNLLDTVVKTKKPFSGKEVPIHFENATPEGNKTAYLDFVYQPLSRSNGEIYAIAAQGYDVTEKVLARKAIEESKLAVDNERLNFRNLFKQTPEMVCILRGADHTFEFVNEAHVRVLGFDATGMPVRQAQPESKEIHGILDEVYQSGETAELHEIPITVTDRLRYFNLTYAARRDDQGKINGVMILGTEVTDQVASRTHLEQAVRSRDEFLSIASHELKTPLTSLQIQAQLRKRNAVKENAEAFTFDKLRRMFDLDRAQIERLTSLIDDMLDVTRIVSNKLMLRLEKADLKTILTDVLERLAPQITAAASSIAIEQVESCEGVFDHFRIEQVMVNLLTNAIRYGGHNPVHITLEKLNGHAKLAVRDEGIGIAEADQGRIFHRFERATRTSSGTGLGLGLYIAKEIVESHGGTIQVKSNKGKGATFIVELPLREST